MSVNEEALMWVEKYRPKTLDDVVGLKDITESLKAFMRNPKTMPHLMLAGIPGTGKTTIALAIAHELYGANWRNFTLDSTHLMREASHCSRPNQRFLTLQPLWFWRHPICTYHFG